MALLLASVFDDVHAQEVWVCLHKLDAMGTMQLRTLRSCDLVPTMGASIVHRSCQAFFFGLAAADRGVKQLKHHMEWKPERTFERVCLTDVLMTIEHTRSDVEISSQ